MNKKTLLATLLLLSTQAAADHYGLRGYDHDMSIRYDGLWPCLSRDTCHSGLSDERIIIRPKFDLSAPRIVIEGDSAYQTLPGTNLRDYSAPRYRIDRDW